MLRVFDQDDGTELLPEDGVYVMRDQHSYFLESDVPLPESTALKRLPPRDRYVATLAFENFIGLARIGEHRFDVRNSKLSPSEFDRLLSEVTTTFKDLAFGFDSPTMLPFEDADLHASDSVLFHALAYLREVILHAPEGEGLPAEVMAISKHPHRRMETKPEWTQSGSVNSVGPSELVAIVAHPERLASVSPGSTAAKAPLAVALGGRFPIEVRAARTRETLDTHENRLVKHVLGLAAGVIGAFAGRRFTNAHLAAEIEEMQQQIDWMRSLGFLDDVGELTQVPMHSTVLQRKHGYREFLGHFLHLGMGAALTKEKDTWRRILDLKDAALLYELWATLQVERVVRSLLGVPMTSSLVRTSDEARDFRYGGRFVYDGGRVELVYNLPYRRGSGSYSLGLRPDVVLRVKRKHGQFDALVLDAKFKFAGDRIDEETETLDDESSRTMVRDDLNKMHTYRDALREALGAFVVYPGNRPKTFRATATAAEYQGVGCVPLVPGEPPTDLVRLVECFTRVEGTQET